MKATEITTIKLEADEGKILTDGKSYGSIAFLGSDRRPDEFHEITKEEYESLMSKQREDEEGNG